ncbi:hypothetical protein P3T76_013075 [Phytophthora citrophthora]|uniref:Uncharacterized protein n=1 Tax=Phytophthora citrophthora TaxID=4793 RepID=A0AAD9G396_9STRA|nr:hypothetical protein P3T76_013075 [Phytophthora citrophthora]
MATSCSGVTTCLSEGSTECSLTSETCPPCVYALTGGDYSCYSRDTSGKCPFSGAYAECDSSSTSTSTSSKSSSKSSGSNSETTPTPTTKTPAKTTATPTEAPTDAPTDAPTEVSTPAPETSTSSSTSDSTSNQTGTSDTSTTTKATTAPSTPSDSDPTQASQTSSSDKGAEKALTSNSTATSGSPAIVNLALIGGAVVLVVIVLAFVARRVVKKKKMAATQEHTVSSGHNSQWSDRTLNTGTSGGNLYSTYSYKDEGKGISMLSDSQASSTYEPGYHGHSGGDQRPTADFSNYGDQSKYAENSQYYSDYSVSTGPEVIAAGAVAGGHYANNAPPSKAPSNFVDVTATTTSMRQSELDSIRSGQQPLTVSQLMPTAIDEDEEEAYATRRKAGNQYGVGHPTTYNFQLPTNAAVPPSTRKHQIFAGSTASSQRSDYDIVDPITMRDVEARNTEMLAEDNRYPKFSFESEASSADLYEGDSSEEESDEERLGHGEEHTI